MKLKYFCQLSTIYSNLLKVVTMKQLSIWNMLWSYNKDDEDWCWKGFKTLKSS